MEVVECDNTAVDDGLWTSSDGRISKRILTKGVWSGGGSTPWDYDVCEAVATDTRWTVADRDQISDYLPPSCQLEGEEHAFSAVIGEAKSLVDRLIERCLRRMTKGEVSQVLVDGGATIGLTLRLVKIGDGGARRPVHEWSAEEKCRKAEEHKRIARVLLVDEGRVEESLHHYRRSALLLALARPPQQVENDNQEEASVSSGQAEHSTWVVSELDEFDAKRERMFRMVCNNMALCRIKLKQPELALQLCSKVLRREADNVKCLLRRAEALREVEEPAEAEATLELVLRAEPNNGQARHLLAEVRAQAARQRLASVDLAKRMLSLGGTNSG